MTRAFGGRHLTSISPSQLLRFKIHLHCNQHKEQLAAKSKPNQKIGIGFLPLEAVANAPSMAYSSILGSYNERGDLVGGTEEGSSI